MNNFRKFYRFWKPVGKKDSNRERGDSYLEVWKGGVPFELEDFLDDGLQDDSEDENCEEERHHVCSPKI